MAMRRKLMENGFVRLKKCRHGPMLYNKNDLFIGRSLDRYGEWCEAEMELLEPLLNAGDIVLDIGANIGTHTVFFAKQVDGGGVVFAIEPQRLAHQMLCANVALNALTNVFCPPVGVGAQPGTARIPVIRPTMEFNFGCLPLVGHEDGEQVSVVTIDSLALAKCDFIKIDVEGMESDVLRGAKETLKRCRPTVFVENNTTERSAELIAELQESEYDCWWHIVDYFNPKNFAGEKENLFVGIQPEANMLCFPSEQEVLRDDLIPVEGVEDDWSKAYSRLQKG